MEPIETIEYRGFNINIYQEDMAEDPRNWENLGIMACWHSRYDLGDDSPQKQRSEMYLYEILQEWYSEEWIEEHYQDMDTSEFITWAIEQLEKHAIVLPLVLLDHSGLWMQTGNSFSCDPGGWDTSRVGFIYITNSQALKEMQWKRLTKKRREKIEDYLSGEVETYSQYLSGDVYGYQIEPKESNNIECDDSCWGFYGYEWEKNGLQEYAYNAIDVCINEYRKKVKEEKKEKREMECFMSYAWAI